MSFSDLPSGWPLLLAVFVCGTLATDLWRWVGVAVGARLDEASTAFAVVRGVATALVAALIGNLIIYPEGAFAEISTFWRGAAFLFGLAAYLASGHRLPIGIIAGEAMLIGAWYFG